MNIQFEDHSILWGKDHILRAMSTLGPLKLGPVSGPVLSILVKGNITSHEIANRQMLSWNINSASSGKWPWNCGTLIAIVSPRIRNVHAVEQSQSNSFSAGLINIGYYTKCHAVKHWVDCLYEKVTFGKEKKMHLIIQCFSISYDTGILTSLFLKSYDYEICQ